MSKKERGQFYTVNHSYIMEGLDKPKTKVIEPFAGKGDLLDWLGHDKWEAYDIEPNVAIFYIEIHSQTHLVIRILL